ncbi:MAG: ABC transporter permease [Nocardioidaceae bacterium]
MTTVTAGTRTTPQLLQYRSLIWNFAQRDLKARFKGTAIGWAWSLLLPIATLVTYTIVGKYVFRIQPGPLGNGHKGNFAVFLFVGLTAWGFFANGLNTGIGTLLGNGPLLKKIYFPSYAPVIGSIIGVGIQSVIEVGLVFVVLAVLGNVGITWLLVPFWAALFFGFVTALSLCLAVANIYFRDLAHLVAVALQLLFYATPVLYPDTQFKPGTVGHRILLSNPMSQFVGVFRDLVYGLTPGRWTGWLYMTAATAAAIGASVWVFQRFGRDLGEQL